MFYYNTQFQLAMIIIAFVVSIIALIVGGYLLFKRLKRDIDLYKDFPDNKYIYMVTDEETNTMIYVTVNERVEDDQIDQFRIKIGSQMKLQPNIITQLGITYIGYSNEFKHR